jgi:hypothetical protein
MPLPVPAAGLVISYDYLWHDQHVAGAQEGRKTRPCAIVVATTDNEGDTLVFDAINVASRPISAPEASV